MTLAELKPIRIIRTILLRTDRRRWRGVARETPGWDERNRLIGSQIEPGSTVLDLGAGAQTLRRHLPSGCTYQPCDLEQSSDDVLLVDFNRGRYPQVDEPYDVVVCSGLIEYLTDPASLIDRLPDLARTAVISYAPRRPGESRIARWAHGWKNHLSQDGLEGMLTCSGLVWEITAEWRDQVIYRLHRAPSDA